MDVKFYKCMHCGNIAVKVFDAGVPLVCCGEKMVELGSPAPRTPPWRSTCPPSRSRATRSS